MPISKEQLPYAAASLLVPVLLLAGAGALSRLESRHKDHAAAREARCPYCGGPAREATAASARAIHLRPAGERRASEE